MKIAESWLREWVNPDLDTEALAHQLTMTGHEVDGVHILPVLHDRVEQHTLLEPPEAGALTQALRVRLASALLPLRAAPGVVVGTSSAPG